MSSILCACLPSRDAPTRVDAGRGDSPFSVRAFDSQGGEHALEAVPRRPALAVEAPLDPADATTYPVLVRGPYDDALAEDAARAPFTQATLARVVATHVDAAAGAATLRPAEPLGLGTTYTLLVPAWAHAAQGAPIGAPRAIELRVAGADAGATLVETFPPIGSVGLPMDLEAIDLRFDDAVAVDALPLLDGAGHLVPSDFHRVECASVGLAAGDCVRVEPDVPLLATATYALDLDEVGDRYGDAVSPTQPSFHTGDASTAPEPTATPTTCALDELALLGGCVLVTDETVSVLARYATSARVTATLGGSTRATVTRAGDARLTFEGLGAETTTSLLFRVRSLSGAETTLTTPLTTTHELPRVVIDEMRADALGPEPAQEFVELWNVGEVSVDLAGYQLADAADRAGDPLPAGCVIAPHGRALVVPDAFDAYLAIDTPPIPGVPLCRIGASLGSSGLANSGEPLFLRDADGHRVAEAPSMAAPGPGRCVVRVAPFSRRAVPEDYAAAGGCSPGAASP